MVDLDSIKKVICLVLRDSPGGERKWAIVLLELTVMANRWDLRRMSKCWRSVRPPSGHCPLPFGGVKVTFLHCIGQSSGEKKINNSPILPFSSISMVFVLFCF